MNTRIKELEKQCWQSTQTEPYALFDSKKFAELIVRECARVYWNIDDGEIHGEYVKALKEHFGVEE
jgi:hypothetical protein